jgi:2-keto-4-pentenoate hydratase/2-oxohepta-3-ene-1,7-dioic acid hydratase in catechol pathway
MTLSPGDIIATGTPSGVGFTREPPVFLVPGDVVEVEVEGIGALTNPVALASDDIASRAAVTA